MFNRGVWSEKSLKKEIKIKIYDSCKLSLAVRWGFSKLEIINLNREA